MGFSQGELNELGISKSEGANLLDWMESVGGNPRAADLIGPDGRNMHKAGALYARAIVTLVDTTIQNPLKSDRPTAAMNPNFAPIYAIQSFQFAFTRNVIFRTLERGIQDNDSVPKKSAKMAANVGLAIFPVGALYTAVLVSTLIREAIFNAEKWEEEEDDDQLANWLMERAFYRTGVFGKADILVNLVSGVRYDTDLTSIYAGAYMANYLRGVQSMINLTMSQNSENNNTAEFNAAKSFYNVVVKSAAIGALSHFAPVRAPFVNLSRVGLGYLSANNRGNQFAEALVGEKGAEHRGRAPWWEMGGERVQTSMARGVINRMLGD